MGYVIVAFPDHIYSSLLFPLLMWVLCLMVLRSSVAIVPKSKWEMVVVLQLYCFYAPVVDWLR